MPSNKPVVIFVIDPALLKRLDDFRYQNRFPSRAGAIKWLLDWALTQNPNPAISAEAESRKKRSR